MKAIKIYKGRGRSSYDREEGSYGDGDKQLLVQWVKMTKARCIGIDLIEFMEIGVGLTMTSEGCELGIM